jgi:hypothetical protein
MCVRTHAQDKQKRKISIKNISSTVVKISFPLIYLLKTKINLRLALLRPTSKDDTNIDPDEINGVIPCLIDNTPVNIDVKTINPFKCVINSAGTLYEDNQTAVIAIYGCALPDHRLREYRYIMDQLF